MLTELRRIVESMAEANTLEQALQALVSQTRLAMTVDCCSVYVAEPTCAAIDWLRPMVWLNRPWARPPCRSSRVSSAWWVSVKS